MRSGSAELLQSAAVAEAPALPQHLMRGASNPARGAGPSKKYKPPKKRVKGVTEESYRVRWLKKLPRKDMTSWLSDICSSCERAGNEALVLCVGGAARCAAADGDAEPWFCPECHSGRMRCFVCGGFGTNPKDLKMRKCSSGGCGRFYHLKCAALLPLSNMGAGGSFFRCPQHYCAACAKRCARATTGPRLRTAACRRAHAGPRPRGSRAAPRASWTAVPRPADAPT
ncbi:hypothetical protein MNEG_2926 [Monoraphidium neglectum]|uniref:Zinc finger PHD-type domain-containing protein n=1 Tax=Monoraphidium neglectum TaxID=145388 RepID=A0A0D2NJH1_9CHLO|nr:hypothetical protein MNEG_2926 [Monoraphidium neglectum]KIZ05026.1 hypothetical protein MNEG_2926 [Monoraphidium neglectum]|eukprot:XP_013904045.1 hypothetical protein MNEG_2926 [Monoraphidium neglectum]